MPNLRRSFWPAAFVIIATGVWLALLSVPYLNARATITDGLENRLLDLRYRIVGPREASPDILFVAIDDETLDAGQAGPVGRARLARLVNHIADSGARALALDVLLADAGSTTERAGLAAALSRLPSVVAAAVRFEDGSPPHVIWPHPEFRAQAETGLVNLTTDATGTPRYVPMFLNLDGTLLPSLPLLAAISFTGEDARVGIRELTLGNLKIPLDRGAVMPLRLLGPADTVPTISAARLMTSPLPDMLDDKMVVLGFSAAAMGDRFVTPFDESTPGAEIIATAISQLIGGNTLRHDQQTRRWDVVHATGLTALCLLLMMRYPIDRAASMTAAFLLLSFACVSILFAKGVWLNGALPLAAALPPIVATGAFRLARDRHRARHSARSLASLRRFQSPALARRIENDPDYLTTPQAQDLVIFFVDLTGFTALSQLLGPDGTRVLLQRFHGLTAQAVEAQGGSVINYIGDGALAVFGLEREEEDKTDADAALAAAGALATGLATVEMETTPYPLACRIGLHRGPVILSRLGADTHQQVSVSGDTVNLTSRLMEVAKSEGVQTVATRDFVGHLSAQEAATETRQTEISVRGRDGTVQLYLWLPKHAAPIQPD
ncbi:MAG: adenylate/guanylate cyclase domain-containing protein [Pseudomonadota bacterium]